MRQCELVEIIEHVAPLEAAESWDHSGIQIASDREEITHLAVCLDPVPTSVRAALMAGADMILSHHPLLLEPRFLDRLDAFHEVASLLLQTNVPLYASHTSLDANPRGPVSWLARELGMSHLCVLEATGHVHPGQEPEFGVGLAGDLPGNLPMRNFLDLLSPWLGQGTVSLVGPDLPESVSRLAICPGSGGSLLRAAAACGAELMITGDVKYHTALESPLPVIDVGHFLLEEEMMRRFAGMLGQKLPVTFIPACDPVRPLPASGNPAPGTTRRNAQ